MQIKGVRFLKLFNINAIVLWPLIIYADREVDEVIINHERIHWDQIRRDGVIIFYARYLHEYFLYRVQGHDHDAAYRKISYEQEAWQHQKNLSYAVRDKEAAS